MKKNNVSSCPFCKCKPTLESRFIQGVASKKHYRYKCKECGIITEWYENAEEAKEKWNRDMASFRVEEIKKELGVLESIIDCAELTLDCSLEMSYKEYAEYQEAVDRRRALNTELERIAERFHFTMKE